MLLSCPVDRDLSRPATHNQSPAAARTASAALTDDSATAPGGDLPKWTLTCGQHIDRHTYSAIYIVYRHFCAEIGKINPMRMTSAKFVKFAKHCGVMHKDNAVNYIDLDLIFKNVIKNQQNSRSTMHPEGAKELQRKADKYRHRSSNNPEDFLR